MIPAELGFGLTFLAILWIIAIIGARFKSFGVDPEEVDKGRFHVPERKWDE